jgi:hypothetical protein
LNPDHYGWLDLRRPNDPVFQDSEKITITSTFATGITETSPANKVNIAQFRKCDVALMLKRAKARKMEHEDEDN